MMGLVKVGTSSKSFKLGSLEWILKVYLYNGCDLVKLRSFLLWRSMNKFLQSFKKSLILFHMCVAELVSHVAND